MLHDLRKHFQTTTSPKTLPMWTQFLDILRYQRHELQRRHLLNYGAESRAIRILKHMLSILDLEYLNSCNNDYDRYINYFMTIGRVLNEVYEPARTGRAYRKTFYKKGIFATSEYLLPVDDVDHVAFLPFNKSFAHWKHLKPVTLWYHNSNEYSLNLLQNQVVFKYTQPTYSVVFIDAVLLAFKYYKFISEDLPDEEDKSIHVFIHKHVMNSLYDDLHDIWLTNEIITCGERVNEITTDETLHTTISGMLLQKNDTQYSYNAQRRSVALLELLNAMVLIKRGNLRVNSLLSSALYPNRRSVIDRMNFGFTYLDVPHRSQMAFMELFRDLPMLQLLMNLYSLRPDCEQSKSFYKELRVLINRTITGNKWNTIADGVTREAVKTTVHGIANMIL